MPAPYSGPDWYVQADEEPTYNLYISDALFDLDAPILFGRAVVGNEDRALIASTGPGTQEAPTLTPAAAPDVRVEPVRVW
jgi:hypothetical protein